MFRTRVLFLFYRETSFFASPIFSCFKCYAGYSENFSNQRRVYNTQNLKNFLKPRKLLQSFPSSIRPFLKLIRFDSPIGTWLLFLPSSWSLSMAVPATAVIPDLWLLSLFAAGSFLMRSSGCIINDLWDKDFDSRVKRTQLRPLASGQVTQLQAVFLLCGTLSGSLLILLQLNNLSRVLGLSCLALVFSYPLMKRYTHWPQVFLGITINWGVLVGWASTAGQLDPAAISLLLASACWTVVYDTIYAHQDKVDDSLIGVKSAALRLGEKWTPPVLSLFAAGTIGGFLTTGLLAGLTWPFYLGVAGASVHLFRQIWLTNLNSAVECSAAFVSNKQLGLIILASILAGNAVRKYSQKKDSSEP